MKIKDIKYIGSYASSQSLPKGLGPEVVFIGRSNVGKSTLINTLIGRKNIARTSNKPGKTRTANFYTVNDTFCFVDVPGYGYAKVSKSERARWRRLIAGYLASREPLAGVVQLLDIRHDPSTEDKNVSEILHEVFPALLLSSLAYVGISLVTPMGAKGEAARLFRGDTTRAQPTSGRGHTPRGTRK